MNDFSHFRLRLPVDLKEIIEKKAKENNRSINAEILYILSNHYKTFNNVESPLPIHGIDYLISADELSNIIKKLITITEKLKNNKNTDD